VGKCSVSRGIVWKNVVYVVGLCGKIQLCRGIVLKNVVYVVE